MGRDLRVLIREIKQRSPHSHVIMVGYGRPMTPNATDAVPADPMCGQFTPAERTATALVARKLDSRLWGSALATGSSYVSPFFFPGWLRPAFAGHSLCEAAGQWYHGFSALAPCGDGAVAIAHPTLAWHVAIADIIERRLG